MELNATEWRNLFRQLIARGLLAVDVEGHGSVILTEASRPVLKGEQPLYFRKLAKASKGPSRSSGRKRAVNIEESDLPLWEALRGLLTWSLTTIP